MSLNMNPQPLRFGRITYHIERALPTPQPYPSLNLQEFKDILKSSGLEKELQDAVNSKARLADIYQPKSFMVTARDSANKPAITPEDKANSGTVHEKAVGLASFVELGEYNFLSSLAVDPKYQHKGIAKKLLEEGILASRKRYITETDTGHSSVATLTSADNFTAKTELGNQFYLKNGFAPLPNAGVLTRKQQKLSYLA